ncbi:MAG: hypothetical protein AAFQ59_02195 [Pseudomonadota bacterium]
MEKDKTTVQWLNLVHTSPTFVIRMGGEKDNANVLSPPVVPNNDGEYWIAGETVLKNGVKLKSVFRVDTNAGGTLVGAYWRIADAWWDFQNRPAVLDALSAEEKEIFPFDWSYAVALEEDIFHD